jgi:hypothetical protein
MQSITTLVDPPESCAAAYGGYPQPMSAGGKVRGPARTCLACENALLGHCDQLCFRTASNPTSPVQVTTTGAQPMQAANVQIKLRLQVAPRAPRPAPRAPRPA